MPKVDQVSLRDAEVREVEVEFNRLVEIMRRLDLQNMDFEEQTVTTPATPGNELTIDHNLERRPKFFIANFVNNPGILYRGSTAWTDTQIFVRSDVASEDVKVLIL